MRRVAADILVTGSVKHASSAPAAAPQLAKQLPVNRGSSAGGGGEALAESMAGVLADFFAESDVEGTGWLSAGELAVALRNLPCCAQDALSKDDLDAVVGS